MFNREKPMVEKTAIVRIRHRSYEQKKPVERQKNGENKFLEHIRYGFSVSSFHGFNHIIWPNRSIFERLFWLVAVLGLGIFGTLKGYEVTVRYLERPCVISVEMDFDHWKNEFPSLTICSTDLNDNYLSARNIKKDSETYEYLQDLAFGNFSTYKYYEKYANGSKKDLLKPEEYLTVLLEAVPTVRNLLGPPSEKSLFPTPEERPIPPIITEMGICSTLNPNPGIYYTPEYLNSTEPYDHEPIYYGYKFSSLKFMLRNFQYSYKISIHSTNEVIDISSKMDFHTLHTITIYSVKTTSIWTPTAVQDLNVRQRNCKLFHENEGLDHSPMYTYNLCKKECRIQISLKFCNCTPYYYRRNPGEQICNMTGMYCLSKYERELVNLFDYAENKSFCNCYNGCFTSTVFVDHRETEQWFSDTRFTVEILKHPDMRYVRKLVFSKMDLIVQIGGILGLCLGCTVLGLIEVVYFATLRFYWGVIKGKSIKSSL